MHRCRMTWNLSNTICASGAFVSDVPEWLPHVHDGQSDFLAAFRTNLIKEEIHIIFGAALTTQPDRALPIKIGNDYA